MDESITKVVFSAIDDINRQFRPTERVEKSLDTVLIGAGARLDSLRLVNFMLAVEQGIARELKKKVNLFSLQYLALYPSTPFTVALLIQTIAQELGRHT